MFWCVRKLSLFAVISVVLSAGLSGCGSATENNRAQNTASESHVAQPSASASQTHTSAAPKPVTSIPGTELKDTVRALGTVFTPCPSGPKFAAPKVLDLATGKFDTPAAPTEVPAGTKLLFATCTLTGTPEDLKVLYLWQYETPAAGLTPASNTVMGAVTGVHDTAPLQPVDLSAQAPVMGDGAKLLPTSGGAVLKVGYGCKVCTVGFDPNAPRVNWTSEHDAFGSDESSVAFQDIMNNVVTIRDVATGQDTVFNNVFLTDNAKGAHDSGYLIVQKGGLGDWTWGYYSTVAKRLFDNVYTANNRPSITVRDGRALLESKNLLRLINISTGDVEFEVTQADLNTLNSYQFSHFGNDLYVKNQNDSPVLDIKTRQRLSAGWKVRPSEWINPSWLLIDHRNTGVGECFNGFASYDCAGNDIQPNDFVLTKVEGGSYTGPMF
ncbi:MAG: hypothetical protein QOH57_2553 [Mycobacterium sp.]|jgi:hypothetical protein|nr:hypothetical protein [Mycobacterium sp.]